MGLLDQDPSFLDSIGPQASETSNDAGTVNVTIRVDGDCFLMCDGDFIDAEFKANKITKIELATGQHFLEFQSAADTSNVVEKIVDYSEKGKSYLLIVQGLGEKSKEEKQVDTIAKFKQEVQNRLDDDRRIDGKEAAELEEIRKKLGLDVKTAQTLINDARRQMRQDSRGTVVREGNTFSIDILKEAILKNDADKIRTILPDVAAAIEASDQESDESKAIQCLYYMCMTALEPKALIQMHESSYVDNYWRAYWVFIAYSRNKQRAKAADTLADLQDIYLDYPDDNVDLLRAIDAYNNIGKKEAMQCVNWVDGNFSTELVSLAEAVRYELGIEKPATRQKGAQVAFIQDNIVSFEDLTVRMKRKEQEEAELRRKVTYTLTITEVRDQMMAMMVARTTLGWGASDSRKKFADLPVLALVADDKLTAYTTYDKLTEGRMTIEVTGVNGLDEVVEDPLGLKTNRPKWDDKFVDQILNTHKGKYMLFDFSGKLLSKAEYDSVDDFCEGLACVKRNDKCGYVDKTGREIIPCKYDEANDFCEELACVKRNDKCGYVDKTGREIIPYKYDDANDFSEGLARVKKNDRYGFIDKTGREVIPCKYDEVDDFNEGLAYVEVDNKYGFIDKTGREIIPCKYDCELSLFSTYSKFSEGLACVNEDNKYGFIDKTGREIIPYKYDDANDFSEGLARVEKNDRYGFIDKTGREVIPCKYDNATDFSEGLAWVKKDGKYGFIDKTGREIIPCKYDDADDFSEGLAWVEKDDKYGFIDKTGREVIPCKYDDADDFSEGLAWVQNEDEGRDIIIDSLGREVLSYDTDYSLGPLCQGLIALKIYDDDDDDDLL